MSVKGDLAQRLISQLREASIALPEREYLFAPRILPDGSLPWGESHTSDHGTPIRRWRFDLAWPAQSLAVEIDGSMFVGGRHGGARSAVRDLEKRAAAAVLGWRVIPVTPMQVRNGTAVRYVRAALAGDEWPFDG